MRDIWKSTFIMNRRALATLYAATIICLILPFPMKKKARKSVYGDRSTCGTLNITERFYQT